MSLDFTGKTSDKLTPVGPALANLQSKFLALAEGVDKASYYECDACRDTGWEVIEGRGAKQCDCVIRKRIARKLACIPTKHDHVRWGTLKPDASRFSGLQNGAKLTAMQAHNINQIKAAPGRNFFFWGQTGLGKTACGYALYRRALSEGMPAFAFTIKDYLQSIRQSEFGAGVETYSELIDLRLLFQKTRRFFVLIDEVSSPGTDPTAFAVDRLRELVDAITYWGPPGGHQLVVTSNYNADDLAAYWSQKNAAAGVSAVRRMVEGAIELEFNA